MENKKQILRKEINRIVKNNKEIVVNEIYYKYNFITKEEIYELIEQYEDYEEAYSVGLSMDFNEDLVLICLDNLMKGLKEYLENCDEDDKQSQRYKIFVKMIKKFKDWKGFTVWL